MKKKKFDFIFLKVKYKVLAIKFSPKVGDSFVGEKVNIWGASNEVCTTSSNERSSMDFWIEGIESSPTGINSRIGSGLVDDINPGNSLILTSLNFS